MAEECLEFVLSQIGSDHTRLHKQMRSRLGNGKNPWALAGDGWRQEARRAVEGEAGKLNTPNRQNTEALIELAVGLPGSLDGISWQGMRNEKVVENLDDFVHDIRGEIVHKGTTPGPLTKGGVEYWISFFDRLSGKFDANLAAYLHTQFATAPW